MRCISSFSQVKLSLALFYKLFPHQLQLRPALRENSGSSSMVMVIEDEEEDNNNNNNS